MKVVLWVVGGLLAAFLIFAAMPVSPERQAKRDARAAIELCWEGQGKKSNSPSVGRFIAGACEKMEDDFVKQYGHKP